MTKSNDREMTGAILKRFGQTYAEEAGIHLKDKPAPLFQLLNTALLLSARISAENAVQAAKALREADLTTPQKMAEATWQDRVDVLTSHGYKRYDESTSDMLGDTADFLIENYNGDLRNLRDQAKHEVEEEHRLLQQFKGIGEVGADIFLREIQGFWQEVYPYADDRVTKTAKELGLPTDPHKLADLVDRKDFPSLVAGLVRIDLANAYDEVSEQAVAT